jgi:hypothetical protein
LKQLDEIQKSTYTQSLANKLRKSAAQTNLQELYRAATCRSEGAVISSERFN